MASKFVPNPLFEQELLRSTLLQDDLQKVAEDIAEKAVAAAPEDDGDYKAGIEAVSGMGEDGVQARVNANDWKSGLIEFGTEDTPTFAPLRRGAEAAGHKVVAE
jgi:hypothetical protein